MTNAQMAHKMGIDKAPHPAWEYAEMLTRVGANIKKDYDSTFGGLNPLHFWEASIPVNGWEIGIYLGSNGTCSILKPNGTNKWYYEKTPAQLEAALKQIIFFWDKH